MKKVFRMTALFAVLSLMAVGCQKEPPEEPEPPAPPQVEGPFDENGASKKVFSISASKQVHFSRGNLQYQASTGTWRFAERQYDVVGRANTIVSESCEGWIDCFGWGTSGWESGANAYQPWATSFDGSDYHVGGDWQHRLQNNYSNADWGVYNPISNGGNQAGIWRTLRNTEWSYLFGGDKRTNKWGRATIANKYKGVILLPDEWTAPDNLSFRAASNYFYSNSYTMEEWERMEDSGAVFLPAGGYRQQTSFFYQNEYGVYWSVSPMSAQYPDNALSLLFSDTKFSPNASNNRGYGFSVRLVKDM